VSPPIWAIVTLLSTPEDAIADARKRTALQRTLHRTDSPRKRRLRSGSFVNQAHNNWAQWASEGGIPFLALMLAIGAMLIGLGPLAVFVHAWID
jgi:hypothetical protein